LTSELPVTHLPAKKLANLISDRGVSAVEVAEAHLKRIEQVNPMITRLVLSEFDGNCPLPVDYTGPPIFHWLFAGSANPHSQRYS
jgi:hypothetical protein